MRENICIILNSKNKKQALKEMHETINLFREDCHLDIEYVCSKYYNKAAIEFKYEEFKQEYRNLSEKEIKSRLEETKCDNIEDYINYVLDVYEWRTLEEFAKCRHNIIRFEGDDSIAVHNPQGYIDYVCGVLLLKKYKNIYSKDIKKRNIARVVQKDKTYLDWDAKKSYKDNKMLLHQSLRHSADANDYIAIVRVHF